jgi:hypothetical protein
MLAHRVDSPWRQVPMYHRRDPLSHSCSDGRKDEADLHAAANFRRPLSKKRRSDGLFHQGQELEQKGNSIRAYYE